MMEMGMTTSQLIQLIQSIQISIYAARHVELVLPSLSSAGGLSDEHIIIIIILIWIDGINWLVVILIWIDWINWINWLVVIPISIIISNKGDGMVDLSITVVDVENTSTVESPTGMISRESKTQ